MTISKKDFGILKFILIIFLGWRILLLFLGFFGLSMLPIQFSEQEVGWAKSNIDFWIRWANWDGGHFRGIAQSGYLPFQVVFFPLYPIFIKSLMVLNLSSLWAGLLISNLFIIAALFYLYKLVLLDFEESIAKKTVFIALAFPTSFYFGAVYSESLFLFLTVASFYFARKKKWFYAYLLASLSSFTRLVGVAVILAISVEYFFTRPDVYLLKSIRHKKYSLIDFKKIFTLPMLFLLVSFLPLIGYSLFLKFTLDDPLAFINYQAGWQRQIEFPWVAPIEYFKNLFQLNFFQFSKTSTQQLLEFLFFIFYLVVLIFSRLKFRMSYTLFFALSLIVPLTTNTLEAIPRYGMVIFPIFILLALIKNEIIYQFWLFFSLTLLGVLTILFINGYWVS